MNFLSYVQLTSLALPSLTDNKGSLVVVFSLLGACTRAVESERPQGWMSGSLEGPEGFLD